MDYAINNAGTTTVSKLLASFGVEPAGLKAVWVSYPCAIFVTPDHFDDELEVEQATLRTYDGESCMADALLTIIDELRRATECTCTFGHEGGYQMAAIMGDICSKKGKSGDLALMRDLAPVMASQAICGEGRALGRAVNQALDLFGDEIEAHITKKTCPAGACQTFRTFHILVSKCTGCGKCLKACDDDAIMGKPRFVHVVNQRKCTQCGACLKACPEGAVVTAGATKPKTPPKPIPVRRKK
ncbi:MAG: 4Fe-4S binding protein [Atopobiaceae bacterium]|nr:4Fe-4S binding protein [Atopobiaceae bacterium]